MTPRESGYIEGVVTAVQDYAMPRIAGPSHKDAGMLRHVITEAMEITDEMVERAAEAAWQAWPGNDDPGWSDLQAAIRPALEAALGQKEGDSDDS